MSDGQEAWIVGAQDKSGHSDEGEQRANIEVPKQVVVLCSRGSGSDRRAKEWTEGIAASWIFRIRSTGQREKLWRAPVGSDQFDDEIERLSSEADWIVVSDQIAGGGIAKHERIDPFGMSDGVEDGDRAGIDGGENG